MVNAAQISQCGLRAVNTSNPLGLVNISGRIYKLTGFINYMDGRDSTIDYATLDLKDRQPSWATDIMLFGWRYAGFRGEGDYDNRLLRQIQSLGLKPERCHCFGSKSQVVFIFEMYEDPISFRTKLTRDPKQALFDYIDANEHIPQILSDYRLAQAWRTSEDLKTNNKNGIYIDYVDADKLAWLFRIEKQASYAPRKQMTFAEIEEQQRKKLEESKANESAIVKFSDYKAIQDKSGYDMMTLHKRIVAQAHRCGGFVDFTYKGQTFSIPKLPLIAHAIQHKAGSFEYNGYKWRAISPYDLKTAEDDIYHTDWWIGAGIPLDAYDLSGREYSHRAFNHELSEFAADLVKRNQLDNFTVLSGRNLPPVSGDLVFHPQSLDRVNDGDILVLTHGGVEFDAYLKKACKSGKGAVIVEIGNKVSHLSIVANEMGYRVILLPSATQLLLGASGAHVDTQQKIINRIEPNGQISM